jgi:hypothetical protein
MANLAVTVVAAATATGNQDITTADLGGQTPKAVIFFYSRSPADGTITDHAGAAYGWATATDQAAVASVKKHGSIALLAGNMASVSKNDKCIVALNTDSTPVVHSEAAFVSFIAGGVRINWTTAHATDAWLITAVFFAGSDWEVDAGTTTAAVSPGTTITTGFEPSVIFVMTVNRQFNGTVATNDFQANFGATCWGAAGRTQTNNAPWGSRGTHQNAMVGTNTWPAYHFELTGQHGWQINTRTATGFEIFLSGGTHTTEEVAYLAMKFTGTGFLQAGTIELTSSSTGLHSFTGLGGQTGGLLFMLLKQSQNTPQFDWRFGVWVSDENGNAGGWAVGAKSDSTALSGANPTVMKSTAMVDKIRMLDNDGTENLVCDLDSFDADGFTLSFSDAPDYDAARGVGFATFQWNYITLMNYVDGGAPPGSETGDGPPWAQAWLTD